MRKHDKTPKDLGFDADFDTFWKEALDMVPYAVSFSSPNFILW
jgi:hypothetical protein